MGYKFYRAGNSMIFELVDDDGNIHKHLVPVSTLIRVATNKQSYAYINSEEDISIYNKSKGI